MYVFGYRNFFDCITEAVEPILPHVSSGCPVRKPAKNQPGGIAGAVGSKTAFGLAGGMTILGVLGC